MSLTAGTHTVQVSVDPGGAVVEQSESNNIYSKTVTVVAPGTLGNLAVRPATESHDFGKLSSGQTAAKVLTFSNSGPGGLTLGTVTLAGADSGVFSLAADTCSGKFLLPPDCSGACAASCTVTVAFAPSNTATATATLTVRDTTLNAQRQVALSGSAEPGRGDFNADGNLSLADAVMLLQVLAGGAKDQTIRTEASIAGDGKTGLADVIHLFHLLAGQRRADPYELVRIRTAFGSMLIWLNDQPPCTGTTS